MENTLRNRKGKIMTNSEIEEALEQIELIRDTITELIVFLDELEELLGNVTENEYLE